MPELPEVETIRRALEKDILGKKIKEIEVLEKKQFIGDISKALGQKITSVSRKGKVLFLKLANDFFLNFHLKLTGEIFFAKDKDKAVFDFEIPRSGTNKLPNKFTRVIIVFSDSSALFFNDLRKFGWVKVSKMPEIPKGVDILSKDFLPQVLTNIINSVSKSIKLVLMDQEKLVGIGNIYANDILWQAKINPFRKSKSLTKEEIETLFSSIKKIIQEAIKYQGSSGADEMYVLPDAKKGSYQHHFKVYDREGKPCLVCKMPIKRLKQNGRSTYYCAKCQK